MTTHLDKGANLQTSRMVWVGGRVSVTDETFEFHPNKLNRAVNGGPLDVVVPLADIDEVVLAGGLVTKKVRVRAQGHEVVVRCYGAREVVETVQRLTGRA